MADSRSADAREIITTPPAAKCQVCDFLSARSSLRLCETEARRHEREKPSHTVGIVAPSLKEVER
jgi:hypothetical protein